MCGPIAPGAKAAIEDIAAYCLVRAPLSLKKLVYLDGEQVVLYRSKLNPGLARNFEATDPLECLARMADHIPEPGKHRALFYGVYANRARSAREPKQPGQQAPPKRKRCGASWARLIHKVHGTVHLGLWPTQAAKPPPAPHELRVVPVDEEGREIDEVW